MKRLDLSWTAAMLFVFSCWALVPGQEVEDVLKIDTSMVTVNVAVTDKKGRHVSELKVHDFLVKDEDRPVQPEFFDTQGPASIVFVVDVSVSMRGEKWESLKRAIKKFLAAQGSEGDDYTLVTFNDAPRLIARSVSAQDFWREFSTLKPAGDTALYDGLRLGLSNLERLPRRHKSLVLLSDGQDNSSITTLQTTYDEMLVYSASIYTVGIRSNQPTILVSEERRGAELLSDIAKATGGLVFFPRAREISNVLDRISEDLRNGYSLSYYPPDKTPGWRRIKVQMMQSTSQLNLRYQPRYLLR
jgi:VWFA-related protein